MNTVWSEPLFWAVVALVGMLAAIATAVRLQASRRAVLRSLSEMAVLAGTAFFSWNLPTGHLFLRAVAMRALGVASLLAGFVLTVCALWRVLAREESRPEVTQTLWRWLRHVPIPYVTGRGLWAAGWALLASSGTGMLAAVAWMLTALLQWDLEQTGYAFSMWRQAEQTGQYHPVSKVNRELTANRWPFRNLVFKGGGVRGLAYLGALRVLDQPDIGILPHVERVAGASAGAITAALLSFRLPLEEMIQLFHTFDYSQFTARKEMKEPRWVPGFVEKEFTDMRTNLESLQRMVSRYGWYSSEIFFEWLVDTIADRCDGNGLATFEEFRKRDFLDLHIVVSNLSQASSVICSAESTPKLPVAEAVRMSMSIPLVFEAVTGREGDVYIDGGVLENFPIHVFDDPIYARRNPFYIAGVNWRTLGCYLYTPQGCGGSRQPISGLLSYLEQLFEAILNMQDQMYFNTHVDRLRSIEISDCCVDPIDFDILPGSKPYQELLESGSVSTMNYLNNYRFAP